jgi:enoyl-CoA hydratase
MGETLVNVSTPAEGVRVLAFNRPTKRNALSQELIDVFLGDLGAAAADQSVKVVVVTGSNTFFCGG